MIADARNRAEFDPGALPLWFLRLVLSGGKVTAINQVYGYAGTTNRDWWDAHAGDTRQLALAMERAEARERDAEPIADPALSVVEQLGVDAASATVRCGNAERLYWTGYGDIYRGSPGR